VESNERGGMIVDGCGDVDWFLSTGMKSNARHMERPVTKLTRIHNQHRCQQENTAVASSTVT